MSRAIPVYTLVPDRYVLLVSATTIKVSKDLRDRIASNAAAQGVSAADFLSLLLDERERQARLAAVAHAYATRDAEYDAETQDWDRVAGDGLA